MTDSPYYDHGSWVLRNLLGKATRQALREAEDELVAVALATLGEADLPRAYSWPLLSGIHRWLFRDVYQWAGEIRREGIAKRPEDPPFSPPERIEEELDRFFHDLGNYAPSPGRKEFVRDIARLYEWLNHIHPFMEGNGRAQRAFWEAWCEDAGHPIDWDQTSREENDAACAAGARGDLEPLRRMFERILL